MNCCKPKRSKLPSSSESEIEAIPEYKSVKHDILLTIPGCKLHLMDGGDAVEMANGDFSLIRLTEDNVPIATIIKVGDELQWPLTKDEPVVKLDAVQYLFSLPFRDGNNSLSYGVTFSGQNWNKLALLDSFLNEHSLFTCSTSSNKNKEIDWQEFAPRVQDYNNVLAKAIAGGTGHIVKGIFRLSNGYANQVHNGGETMLIREVEKNDVSANQSPLKNSKSVTKKNATNKNLKRVRKLSQTTERMSKALLDGVGIASGSVMAPIIRSQPGKSILAMVPGEVLLASLEAVNAVLDAAEAAEKQALTATSGAVTRVVAKRYGDEAGEATEDAFASAGHVAGTAWNIFKIRKAINPASSIPSGILKNAVKPGKR